MNKNDLKDVALAVGGTYVGAGASDSIQMLVDEAVTRAIRSKLKVPKLKAFKIFDIDIGSMSMNDAFCVGLIEIRLIDGYKYIGGKKPIIHLDDDGCSVSNGIDGNGALLSKTGIKTVAKLQAVFDKALKIIAKGAERS